MCEIFDHKVKVDFHPFMKCSYNNAIICSQPIKYQMPLIANTQ